MKQRCDICRSTTELAVFLFGGVRPTDFHHQDEMTLCVQCLDAAKQVKSFRSGNRDTTNSRYSIIKAAVKRARFGDPNFSIRSAESKSVAHDWEVEEWL